MLKAQYGLAAGYIFLLLFYFQIGIIPWYKTVDHLVSARLAEYKEVPLIAPPHGKLVKLRIVSDKKEYRNAL